VFKLFPPGIFTCGLQNNTKLESWWWMGNAKGSDDLLFWVPPHDVLGSGGPSNMLGLAITIHQTSFSVCTLGALEITLSLVHLLNTVSNPSLSEHTGINKRWCHESMFYLWIVLWGNLQFSICYYFWLWTSLPICDSLTPNSTYQCLTYSKICIQMWNSVQQHQQGFW